jgi:molybdate-binding protein/DNA-binding transcriptional regulator YhcF (GntR family)
VGEEKYLYQTIADAIRDEILRGELKPGDRVPTVRQMTERWKCTPGTVQRAYRELSDQGLVRGRRGRGTVVVGSGPLTEEIPLRRAELVHRAEGFLLEVITAGHTPEEVEQAITLALDRWRSAARNPRPAPRRTVRFVGSHDLAMDWIAAHFGEIVPRHRLQVRFTGSLGGLIALAEGEADLAGCHLWDEETGSYNEPFVRRLLPGRSMALITLAQRRLGLMVSPGNPHRIRGLKDLTRKGVRWVNRQPGSGTRVWLDAQLHRLGVDASAIEGYERAEATHSGVARLIAEGKADAGLGLEAAAEAFGLEFIYLTGEPYQLAAPAEAVERPPLRTLVGWLKGRSGKAILGELRGYDVAEAGKVIRVA